MSFKGKGKKGSILDLNKYMDQAIRVKFSGGREGTKRSQADNQQHASAGRWRTHDPRVHASHDTSSLFPLFFSLFLPVTGVLKGYDPLLNLVLDSTEEFLRDPFDPYKLTGGTRTLGLTVARGTAVMMVCPVDGTMEIANPFLQQEEEPAAVI